MSADGPTIRLGLDDRATDIVADETARSRLDCGIAVIGLVHFRGAREVRRCRGIGGRVRKRELVCMRRPEVL